MINKQQRLILASSSKYRQALLARLGLSFESIAPEIDEKGLPNESPKELVQRLALSKAEIISDQYGDAIVIGSDQVAVYDNQIIGKPGTYNKALQQLKKFSGNQVIFLTAVALVCHSSQFKEIAISKVIVNFKVLEDKQIKNYLLHDKPYDCAGSFKIESMGVSLFESVCSDDPTSLEGLPLIIVCNLLHRAGIEII